MYERLVSETGEREKRGRRVLSTATMYCHLDGSDLAMVILSVASLRAKPKDLTR